MAAKANDGEKRREIFYQRELLYCVMACKLTRYMTRRPSIKQDTGTIADYCVRGRTVMGVRSKKDTKLVVGSIFKGARRNF
ncbi:hypothetical protein COOONC_15953 [Cooperia oncophora]